MRRSVVTRVFATSAPVHDSPSRAAPRARRQRIAHMLLGAALLSCGSGLAQPVARPVVVTIHIFWPSR